MADCQNENPQFVKKFVQRKKISSCHIYRLSTRNTDENTKTWEPKQDLWSVTDCPFKIG